MTVAVKVTDWPNVAGLGDAASVVLDAARFTTCSTAGLVPPRKRGSPP